MADYLELGYDLFLQKSPPPITQGNLDFSSLNLDTQLEGISGSKILGQGKFTSADGRMSLDLTNNVISISDGQRERVRIGKAQDTGESGLQVWDENGKQIIKLLGKTNFIQSPDGHTIFDFDENRILIKDDNNVPTVLLGKDAGGF